jgi:hypothetical protein
MRISRVPVDGAILIDVVDRAGRVASREVFVPFSTR